MTTHPRFYRASELHKLLGIGLSTLWNWVKKGMFPAPIKLSQNVTVWSAEEVEIWIRKQKNPPDDKPALLPKIRQGGNYVPL